ncbi:UNVERIFIED_CONTAM: WD repeat-containing protein 6 [Sesamum radiatum]|uniref:WD repeat-containing protein 6 n=1 Tax=Sesamum radiatum TaxID=300843 RepID=A0AAW2W341_SESRA
MGVSEQSPWQLLRRQYLGEISALCFLRLPSHLCSLPLLLAGTGSQILVYDLVSGKIIRSFPVFEGIRVHGISVEHFHKPLPGSAVAFRIAVFGERRVKLFNLQIESDSLQKTFLDMGLTLIHSLPKFGHWVLDVCFLKNGATSSEDACHLAIGCSDNSICFWDILRCDIFSEVKCAERCLLYSMRMLGNDIESLRIASGTIFNEIIVWKVVHQNHSTSLRSNAEDHVPLTSNEDFIPGSKYKDALISRLVGHEGSIFRIAWFSNGMKLVSVSDDRSARIWEVQAEKGVSCKDRVNHLAGPVLFGHSARIWDCCIYDSLIITAGEDCTCRIWDHDGRELNVIKEHIGRGVWRCLYDPCSSLLVTAGFDSAIKLHKIYTSSKELEETSVSEDFSDRKELFALSIPNTSWRGGLMDRFSYVATNNGYLYHASLFNNEAVKWTELARISEEAPIICMDLLPKFSYPSGGFEDWIAVGDGKGRMTVVLVVGTGGSPKVECTLTWPAEKERHLLGAYWCKSLENRFIFTSDPSGGLKLWKLCNNSHSASLIGRGSCDVSLIAEYASCFGMRIMCVDASSDQELLVCGDIRGNLLLFSLPRGLLCATAIAAEVKASPVNYFKGAHGVSSVSSVSIYSPSDQVEIRSTGADGCICYLQHNKDMLYLEFVGMKQVKELSAIRSVFTTTDHSDDSAVGNYAVGFASANFIIWNLTTGTKVLDITCGGWRRPHSYYLGDLPEMMNCFSFVKDDVIYIHRHWVPENDRQIYPRNLHVQFHGREVHSLCFICGHSLCSSDEDQGLVSGSSWIATGCEDGTVRLTRYKPGMENWLSSQHLGEHVSGSAVRSVCSVSKMHIFLPESRGLPNVVDRQNGTLENRDPFILISVGAKRVVTAWKQMIIMSNKGADSVCQETDKKNENNLTGPSTETMSSFSFQWLSTDMPFKHTSYVKRQYTKEVLETDEDLSTTTSDSVPIELLSSRCRKKEANLCPEDDLENDWRYLDVTAFLVKEYGSRISVCFVIVACSDATVTLRALVLPFRCWFDVALLAPLSSPVLALQHVVIPKVLPSNGFEKIAFWGNVPRMIKSVEYTLSPSVVNTFRTIQIESLYLAITGSTDGSIGIWDLTECVENFMRQISGLQMENCMEFQKRPRTGRGSQGGRWWRSIGSHSAKKKPHNCDLIGKTHTGLVSVGRTESDNKMENHVHGTSETSLSGKSNAQVPFQVDNQSSVVSVRKKDDLSPEASVLVAMHVLGNVHQSGVNCLNVSDVQDLRPADSRFSFYVISGGDDQAINCLRCDLKINHMQENSQNMSMKIHCTTLPVAANNYNGHCLIKNHQMQFSNVDKIISAHSSAVKGFFLFQDVVLLMVVYFIYCDARCGVGTEVSYFIIYDA